MLAILIYYKLYHLNQHTSALASQASKSISNKCIFCLGQHWSDKCDVITNSEARKKLFEKDVLIA